MRFGVQKMLKNLSKKSYNINNKIWIARKKMIEFSILEKVYVALGIFSTTKGMS